MPSSSLLRLWLFAYFSIKKHAKTPIIRPALAVCKAKISFQPIFGGFMREAQQTARFRPRAVKKVAP
jgi:hypothetical protein